MATENYCPYCNRAVAESLTDEHVIPQCIGGDASTVIRICRRCNSNAGENIDSKVSRHSFLRSYGIHEGIPMTRHEKHESIGTLKDGRELEGIFYMHKVGQKSWQARFQPSKHQPDGSIWISEDACKNPAQIPSHINLYRGEMLERASFRFAPPEESGLEPVMAKILLGFIAMRYAREVVSLPNFDCLRQCLVGPIPGNVEFNWLQSLDHLRSRCCFPISDIEHTVWGSSIDGVRFLGGVSLYGKVIAEISIYPFGLAIGYFCANQTMYLRNGM